MVVMLAPDASVEQVNLIAPDGRKFASTEVVSGETRVEFALGTSYAPGTFRVTSDSGAETSIEIRPELEILEVGVGANHMERMPDGLGTMQEEEAYVFVENSGNGPVALRDLMFRGDVPNPSPELRESDSRSGIFDLERDSGEVEQVTLLGRSSITLFSTTIPFSFEGEGRDCKPTPYSGDFTVSLAPSVAGIELESQFEIRYSGASKYDGCSVTAEGAEE
ncbi:hypothetical protein [Natronomonas sp. EA1]|uniref:hypothetical protein n=1 Tax=Natronomonas sp. EA1 TaxID=3421655 RepID=UPI003EBE4E60